MRNTIDFLLNTANPLEEIDLRDIVTHLKGVYDSFLQRHGGSLKVLRLQEGEWPYISSSGSGHPKSRFNTSELALLQANAPHLEEVDLHLERFTAWPYDQLNTLASMSNLTHLTLRLEVEEAQPQSNFKASGWDYQLGRVGEDDPQPIFNESVAQGLFRYMRRVKQGKPLDIFILYVDDMAISERRWHFGGGYSRGRGQQFACKLEPSSGREFCKAVKDVTYDSRDNYGLP